MTELRPREPLLVHVVWHSDKGVQHPFAAYLHARLSGFLRSSWGSDDAKWGEAENPSPIDDSEAAWSVVDPPGVPVRFRVGQHVDGGALVLPRTVEIDDSDLTAIILLIESTMLQHRVEWRRWLEALPSDKTRLRLIPVAMTTKAEKLASAVEKTNVIPNPNGDWERLTQSVSVVLSGMLSNEPDRDDNPAAVFLCHTKAGPSAADDENLGGEPLAKTLRTFLLEETQTRVFFDRADLPHAADVEEGIRKALLRSAVVVILTDALPESEWCQMELRMAREHDRPVVVVDALKRGLGRTPLHLEGARVVRSEVGTKRIVSILLLELVRARFFDRRAVKLGEHAKRLTFVNRPSLLVRLQHRTVDRQIVVYPDPPWSSEDLSPLRTLFPRTQWRTLVEQLAHQNFGRASGRALADLTVGLSVSGDAKVASHAGGGVSSSGLGQRHVDDVFCEIARLLMTLGGKLAVGADFRPEGFTTQLLNVVERYGPVGGLAQDSLLSCLAWPIHIGMGDAEREWRLSRADLHECAAPPGTTADSGVWNEPVALAQAFTSMRHEMTLRCDARIAFGGKLTDYKGAMPGVLEEVWLACRDGQPLYLLGGLGGVAASVFNVVFGRQTDELLTLSGQAEKSGTYRDLVDQLGYVNYREMEQSFHKIGLAGLSKLNGLEPAENLRLAVTLDPLEIVDLISKGLARSRKRMRRRRERLSASTKTARQ